MSQYSDGAICPMGNRVIHLHSVYLKYDPESWRVTGTRITVLNISNTNSIERIHSEYNETPVKYECIGLLRHPAPASAAPSPRLTISLHHDFNDPEARDGKIGPFLFVSHFLMRCPVNMIRNFLSQH